MAIHQLQHLQLSVSHTYVTSVAYDMPFYRVSHLFLPLVVALSIAAPGLVSAVMNYRGCYPASAGWDSGTTISGNTAGLCITQCEGLSSIAAAVQGNGCWCTSSWFATTSSSSPVSNSTCNTACPGGGSNCGGSNVWSVFTTAPAIARMYYVGCYPGSLGWDTGTHINHMTSNMCNNYCSYSGNIAAAIKLDRCWCSTSWNASTSSSSPVSDPTCNSQCPGGGNNCGGTDVWSVFSIAPPMNYVGCYPGSMGWDGGTTISGNNATICTARCRGSGSIAAAVQGNGCWCSSSWTALSSSSSPVSDSTCNTACPGGGSNCGGTSVWSVFGVQRYNVAAVPMHYKGCYPGSPGWNAPTTNSANTAASCIQSCYASGNNAAAVQGNGCWCSSSWTTSSASQAGDASCTTSCPGNTNSLCGGPGVWSIFTLAA